MEGKSVTLESDLPYEAEPIEAEVVPLVFATESVSVVVA